MHVLGYQITNCNRDHIKRTPVYFKSTLTANCHSSSQISKQYRKSCKFLDQKNILLIFGNFWNKSSGIICRNYRSLYLGKGKAYKVAPVWTLGQGTLKYLGKVRLGLFAI